MAGSHIEDKVIEGKFHDLGVRIVTDAAAVKCSIPDYIAGLRGIIGECKLSIEAAESDLERMDAQAKKEDPPTGGE